MSSVVDRYRDWDAAYVLGALSVAERHEYEDHLRSCPSCREAVAELAAVPGLLGQVPATEWTGDEPGPTEPLPPGLVLAVRRRDRARRRRREFLIAVVAVVALFVGGLTGYAANTVWGHDSNVLPASEPYRLAFSPLAPSSITAVVDVVPVTDGTEFRVECQYGSRSEWSEGPDYSIYVIADSGDAVNAKTWTVKPEKVMHPVAASPLPESKISSLEIRETRTGKAMLRATLP